MKIYKLLLIRTWQLMMIYKHDLWNLPTKITLFLSLIYLFNVIFYDRFFSYFAKPNFIVYDEWFDNNFKKLNLIIKIKKQQILQTYMNFFMNNRITKLGAMKITCK